MIFAQLRSAAHQQALALFPPFLSYICLNQVLKNIHFSFVLCLACVDKHGNCGRWASRGECNKNPGYMHTNCRRSCNVCSGGGGGGGGNCQDSNGRCASWAARGECQKNPKYMLTNCKKSCNACGGCRDSNAKCATWASRGECRRNPSYMLSNCKRSCRVCGQ